MPCSKSDSKDTQWKRAASSFALHEGAGHPGHQCRSLLLFFFCSTQPLTLGEEMPCMLSIQRASNSASSIITAAPAPSGGRMDRATALLGKLKRLRIPFETGPGQLSTTADQQLNDFIQSSHAHAAPSAHPHLVRCKAACRAQAWAPPPPRARPLAQTRCLAVQAGAWPVRWEA